MLINDEDALRRLNSPMNLINKMKSLSSNNVKRKDAMGLFGIGRGVDVKVERVEKSEEREVITSFNPFKTSTVPKAPTPFEALELIPSPPAQLVPQPTLETLLDKSDSQIKLGLAHDTALDLLTNSVNALALKLDEVRADRLPSVISAASKVVESIRKERAESARSGKDQETHYHFYVPEQRKVSDYEIIEVSAP